MLKSCMIDRFPPLQDASIEELISTSENLHEILPHALDKLDINYHAFLDSPSENTLRELANEIFNRLPMSNKSNQLNSLLTTREQLSYFMNDALEDIGDCKLLTIITAYITSTLGNHPTLISIRNYSEHPVLYVKLHENAYKISYVHKEPYIKEMMEITIFESLGHDDVDEGFEEEEFPNSKSLLFWSISKAISTLDHMNLMRRCLVNLPTNPSFFYDMYQKAKDSLASSQCFSLPIIEYWESEMERIKDMTELGLVLGTSPHIIKNNIIRSLRFSE